MNNAHIIAFTFAAIVAIAASSFSLGMRYAGDPTERTYTYVYTMMGDECTMKLMEW
jgi:hypothetical protein